MAHSTKESTNGKDLEIVLELGKDKNIIFNCQCAALEDLFEAQIKKVKQRIIEITVFQKAVLKSDFEKYLENYPCKVGLLTEEAHVKIASMEYTEKKQQLYNEIQTKPTLDLCVNYL
jgi:tyrosine-protein phosphatase YwqE